MFDAIVVGGRCAGSPTAMLLARQGYRVLIVDRASFPSDTVSTHYIPRIGVTFLERWGLADHLIATNCPKITEYNSDWGDFTLVGHPPPVNGAVGGYAPRRTVLDSTLLQAAIEAGAEVREQCTVTDLLFDGDQVVGIEGRTGDGARFTEQSTIVIGADGRNSFVARTVGAPKYHETPSLAFQYYSYWSGVSRGVLEAYRRGRQGFFVFPTNDGLACVITAGPIETFDRFRADHANNYRNVFRQIPDLDERMTAGRQEDRIYGTPDLPNFLRQSYGPGWALVGDAGFHKDPQTGQGIRDCFRDAEILSRAIHEGISGIKPMQDALAAYQSSRDSQVREMLTHTIRVAAMKEPTEKDFALRTALRENKADLDIMFGIGDGTVSPNAFFAPDNIGRILRGEQSKPVSNIVMDGA